MTLPEARNILDKYWEGKSTLEEEDQLKEFFASRSRDSLPPDMQQTAELFSFYDNEADRTTHDIPLSEVDAEDRNQTKTPIRSWLKYAAAVILLMAGISMYFYTNQSAQMNEQNSKITYQERVQAFKTTKKALKLVAGNLNKGTSELRKLAVFDEIQHEIIGN